MVTVQNMIFNKNKVWNSSLIRFTPIKNKLLDKAIKIVQISNLNAINIEDI